MEDKKRIMLECRYLLSLNKSYYDIAKYMKISERIVYNDLNVVLPSIDKILYKRVKKVLES